MKVDILTDEIENKKPYWLSPLAKQADLMAKIREKHRRLAKDKEKAKSKNDDKA